MTPGEMLWTKVALGKKLTSLRTGMAYAMTYRTWAQVPQKGRAFWEREARALGIMADSAQDPVNRPAHYTTHESGVECIAITEHMNFCVGNAMKYLWRAGLKSGASDVEDLKKAAWYIAREIALREKKKEAPK